MSGLLEKMTPTAIVAAMVTWCCWSYLSEPGSGLNSQKHADLPRVTNALLTPAIKPGSSRDPFRPAETTAADSAKPQGRFRSASSEKGSDTEANTTDVVSSLVLDATYVQGDRRMALISGRVYTPGKRLAETGPGALYVVKEVLPDRVLIQSRSRTGELTYRNSDVASGGFQWIGGAEPDSMSASTGGNVISTVLNILLPRQTNAKP